jgi:hypothetical protein
MKRSREEEKVLNQKVEPDEVLKKQKVEPDEVLALKNPHKRDKFVKFTEEKHLYFVDWEQNNSFTCDGNISSSALYKQYFPVFDADAVSLKCSQGKNKEYAGKSCEDIKNSWNERANLGTILHREIELTYNGYPPKKESLEYKQFSSFQKEIYDKYIPLRTEWKIYSSPEYKVTGTIDMVFVPRNKELRESVDKDGNRILNIIIVDWKRSKQIRKYPFDYGFDICKNIGNVNYEKYSFQQNIYVYILHNFYNGIYYEGEYFDKINVCDVFLIVMHPKQKTKYKKEQIYMDKYQPIVKQMFEKRKLQINNFK